MAQTEITYEGGLQCSAVHGQSGRKIQTDVPVDSGGKGSSFSPTDLVAAALGTCMATTMGKTALPDKIDLSGMNISVEKEMTAEGIRRIARLTIRVDMPAGLDASQRAMLEQSIRSCPVRESLRPEIEIAVRFVYPD